MDGKHFVLISGTREARSRMGQLGDVSRDASVRVQAARTRLERLGIIDANGKLVSSALPPDMKS
jgi:hypothetical protein